MRTLCIDIGGSGIKAMILDGTGKPVTERQRVETPQPAEPAAVIDATVALVETVGAYDRISVGYPGVVVGGVTRTGHNLGEGWGDFPLARALEERLGKPVRAANDAGVQGLGVVEGKGTEVVLTLGTGMGFGLYIDGIYVPNIEMAHHPFDGKKTYEERVSDKARKKLGLERWEKRVREVVDQLRPILNWRRLYLGGGNARRMIGTWPEDVTIVDNTAGLLGGFKLWADAPAKKRTVKA
ncbi:MAG: ROK family protein [Deltaproteobacteria bacterium]|nr:ROK family protein [Deltaproteobacteria bacterium]